MSAIACDETVALCDSLSKHWLGGNTVISRIASLLVSSSAPTKRILIDGYSGSGKTLLLRQLHLYFEEKSTISSYVDIASLTSNKGSFEHALVDHFASSIVLIDNIDAITHLTTTTLSLLLHLLDTTNNTVLATATSTLPMLTLPYRFSSIVSIPRPDYEDRCEIFYTIAKKLEMAENDFHAFVSDLASRTQGYSVCDIITAFSSVQSIPTCDAAIGAIAAMPPASSNIQNNKYLTTPASTLIQSFQPLLTKILRRILVPELLAPSSQSLARFSRPTSGILISGPPGCGKTSLAFAIAASAAAKSNRKSRYQCMTVSCAELVQKVVGASEKMIADIFQAARAVAPCFLLLDNIDVLFGSNSTTTSSLRTTHQAIDRMLSAMLVEIDGLAAKDNQAPVVVLATATNTSCIDRALLRPGRLEERIELSLPTSERRREIFLHYINTRGNVTYDAFLLDELVAATDGRTPADIKQVILEGYMTLIRNRLKDMKHEDCTSDLVLTRDLFPVL